MEYKELTENLIRDIVDKTNKNLGFKREVDYFAVIKKELKC